MLSPDNYVLMTSYVCRDKIIYGIFFGGMAMCVPTTYYPGPDVRTSCVLQVQWQTFMMYEGLQWVLEAHDDVIKWNNFLRYWPFV